MPRTPGNSAGIPRWLALPFLLLCLASCATPGGPPPEVVPEVDLARYMGTWYEIARFPFWAQEGCYGTTATYTLRPDGTVRVLNQCRLGSLDGNVSSAEGSARVVDPTSQARLAVTFFWPFSGDYWIIELDKAYQYAVVSVPSRKYLWILSRTPIIAENQYQDILDRLAAKGFDLGPLIRTPQRAP